MTGSKDALEQLILRLFHDIDADDGVAVANAFSTDGIWMRRSVARIGRAAVLAEMHARPAGRRIQHIVTNLLILRCDPVGADVSFKALAFADPAPVDGRPSPMTHPIALDSYDASLRCTDGEWLVARLTSDRLFAG